MERLLEFALNHPFLVTLFIALLMMLLWNLLGGSLAGVMQIQPAQMTSLMNRDDAVVVDIRSEDDFRNGHIINAVNIPAAEISGDQAVLEKSRDKPVVLYCQNGTDSPRAARKLKGEGFENVSVLKGGLSAWRSAGMPLSKGNDR